MPTSAKEMLEAARAVVPTITAQDAAELVKTKGAVVVDVRDAAEVAGSGKVQGALAISRGLLEFRADPDIDKLLTSARECQDAVRESSAPPVKNSR